MQNIDQNIDQNVAMSDITQPVKSINKWQTKLTDEFLEVISVRDLMIANKVIARLVGE